MNRRSPSLPKSIFKSRNFLRRTLTRVSTAAALALLFADLDAKAAVRTWVGSTSADWFGTTGFDGTPVSGDSLVFGADGTAGTSASDVLTNTLTNTAFNIAGITFNAGAPAYTMTGNTFNLTAGITNSSSNLQTFNNTGVVPVTGSTGGTVSNAVGLTANANLTWNVGTAGITLSGLQFNTINNSSATTTVNGTGGTLTIGYLGLGTNTNSRLVDNFAGTGNISVGTMAPGGSASLSSDSFSYGGTGTFTLTGSHTGGTFSDAINSGTFVLSGNEGSGLGINNAAVFTETSTGVLSGTANFAYNSTAATSTLAGANTLTGAITVGAGALTLSGSINAANATTGSSITVNGGAFNESSTGVINGSGSGSTAGGQITLNAGTVDLQGANNTTGNVTVNGGTFTVDSTGGKTANVLKSNGVTLTIGGGTTNFLLSNNATANTETLYQTVFTTNTSSLVQVTQNGNTGTGGVINLGNTNGFARNAGSIADFGTLPTTGTVLENTAGKANAINGVLASNTAAGGGVAFATVGGGTNFASINTTTGVIGTVVPATGTYSATANVSVTGGDTPASGAGANTLTFAGTTGATLTLAGINTITAGGILVTPSTTGTTTITGGTIRGGAGKELVLINNEPNTAGSLTISSIIADSTTGSSALTIGSTLGAAGIAANPQGTILTAANTFTGQTTLLNGTLNLSNQLALQNSTLQPNTGTTLVFDQSVTGNAFTLGNLQGGINIVLANNATTPAAVALTIGGNNSGTTYSGVLSGAGSLTKTGTGTDTLTNANTYTGATVVNGGILVLGNASAIKTSSSVTVTGTGLLGLQPNTNEGSELATGVVIQGTGGITNEINDPNKNVTLDRANTYTGPTTWAIRGVTTAGIASTYTDATNTIQTSGAFGVNSPVVFTGVQATLLLNGFNNQVGSLAGTAGGGAGIELKGATFTIGGNNTNTTYQGAISNNYLLGDDANGNGTSGQAPGGNIVKIGTGTQTINSIGTGLSSYEGTTTIKGGILSINVLGSNGNANNPLGASGFVTPATTTFTSGSTTVAVTSTAGLVVGQNIFDIPATGVGTTITAINAAANTITLSSAPGFTGARTNVPFGFGSSIGLSGPAAANLVLDGGTLQYTGAATSTDRLFTVGSTEAGGATGTLDASGTGALNFTNTGAVAYGTTNQPRTLGLTGSYVGANTLSPAIGDNGTGAVAVTKSGVGSWTLASTNTYSGGTSVNAGTLLVNNTSGSGTGSGSVGVGNGMGANGTLGGTGIIGGAVAVNPGSTISPGAVATPGVIGMLTLNSISLSGNYNVDLGSSGSSDLLTITGAAAFNSGAKLIFAGATDGSTYTLATYMSDNASALSNLEADSTLPSGYTLTDTGTALELMPAAVPEPSTWLGGVLLLGGMAWQYRRQSVRRAS